MREFFLISFSILFLTSAGQNDSVLAKKLCDSARVIMPRNPDEGLRLAQMALKAAMGSGSLIEELNSYRAVGYAYNYKGENKIAIEYAFKAADRCREAGGSKTTLANMMVDIGGSYSNLSDYENALKSLIEAMKLYDEAKDERGLSNVYNSIGNLYYQQKNYPMALEYYERALKLFQKLKSRFMLGMVYSNIGVVYNDQGQYDKAEYLLNKAINYLDPARDERLLADINNNLGVNYYERKKYSKALEYYLKAMRHYEKMNNRPLMGVS
jgi:tetratricopeptide (TPR) repeat protein